MLFEKLLEAIVKEGVYVICEEGEDRGEIGGIDGFGGKGKKSEGGVGGIARGELRREERRGKSWCDWLRSRREKEPEPLALQQP